MLSLEERIDLLESDLKAVPMRISVYHDLPFAILHYEPEKEWELRSPDEAAENTAGADGETGQGNLAGRAALAGNERD